MKIKNKYLPSLSDNLNRYLYLLDTSFLYHELLRSSMIMSIKKGYVRLQSRLHKLIYLTGEKISLPFDSAAEFEDVLIANKGNKKYWWGSKKRNDLIHEIEKNEEKIYKLNIDPNLVIDEYSTDFLHEHLYQIFNLVTISGIGIASGEHRVVKKNRLLDTDDEHILYKGNIMELGKDTTYYLVIKFLLQNADSSGFCDYKSINNYLELNGQDKMTDRNKAAKRITNAKDNFFHIGKIRNINTKGERLIAMYRGKGLILNNL